MALIVADEWQGIGMTAGREVFGSDPLDL